jgi:hypothetical protein
LPVVALFVVALFVVALFVVTLFVVTLFSSSSPHAAKATAQMQSAMSFFIVFSICFISDRSDHSHYLDGCLLRLFVP